VRPVSGGCKPLQGLDPHCKGRSGLETLLALWKERLCVDDWTECTGLQKLPSREKVRENPSETTKKEGQETTKKEGQETTKKEEEE